MNFKGTQTFRHTAALEASPEETSPQARYLPSPGLSSSEERAEPSLVDLSELQLLVQGRATQGLKGSGKGF